MDFKPSVVNKRCVSCGLLIGWRPDWVQKFRAIYTTSDGVRLSGIGVNKDYRRSFVVPVEETAQWNNIGDGKSIHLWPTWDDTQQNAFMFHEVCWDLLMEHFRQGELCLDRLFEVCSVLPQMCTSDFAIQKPNPCDIPTVEDLVPSAVAIRRPSRRVADDLDGEHNSMTDCLGILPFEIREEIATYLSTADIYNLRLASRGMVGVFASQTFWKTRFYVNQDRGFLGYLLTDLKRRKDCPTVDWQLLYRTTNKILVHVDQVGIRKQIWDMNQWLEATTAMKPTREEDHTVMSDEKEPTHHWDWKGVQGAICPGHEATVPTSYRYLTPSYKYTISIPPSLTGISASVFYERDRTYIIGMGLICEDNSTISVGYKLPGTRVMLLAIQSLRGFQVAIGSGGIRALKPIATTPNSSQWLGSPADFDPIWHSQCDRACITTRLVSDVEIDALEFTFDQYRMIKLAIGKKKPIVERERNGVQDDFRLNALWYPKIPPSKLFLNEGSFMGEDPLVAGYQPAYWALFGGIDGRDLASLSAISVDMMGYQIKFFYNKDEELPRVTFDLGYRPSPGHLNGEESIFPIDGPGGERIDAFHVAVQVPTGDRSPYRHFKQGVPLCYKVSTNRGRSFFLNDLRKYGSPQEQTVVYKSLDIAPGTAIIGFYAVQNYEIDVLSLGVMSVPVEG